MKSSVQARLWSGWAPPAPYSAVPHLQGEGAPVEQGRAGQGGGQVRGAALQQGRARGKWCSISLFCINSYHISQHHSWSKEIDATIYFQINTLFIANF